MSHYFMAWIRKYGLFFCVSGLLVLSMYTPTVYHASATKDTVCGAAMSGCSEPYSVIWMWRATVSLLPPMHRTLELLTALYEWRYPFGIVAYFSLIGFFSTCAVAVWCRFAHNTRTLFGFFKNRFVDK